MRVRMGITLVLAFGLVLSGSPVSSASSLPAGPAASVSLGTPILSGYRRPVAFVLRGPQSRVGYVVEQAGVIRRAKYHPNAHTWSKAGVFLDIRTLIKGPDDGSDELGLLGLAFAPDYRTSGLFYVYYTAKKTGRDVVAEFRRQDFLPVDPATRRMVLSISDPYVTHNAGMLLFRGNNLYIADGDGGDRSDPGNRAQDLGVKLGKILRIDPRDPDGPDGPLRYSVPTDNPFVATPHARPEIWSYGLRNPWRFSFDSLTGDVWIGDVGQCQFEEIDHAGDAKGANFGWRLLEGTHVFDTNDCHASEPTCVGDCHTLPVAEYSHDSGCAVIGGWVYRGSQYPAWYGRYLFGDVCSGRIWTVNADGEPGAPLEVLPETDLPISSFAQDAAGELYMVELGGSIYKLALNGTL